MTPLTLLIIGVSIVVIAFLVAGVNMMGFVKAANTNSVESKFKIHIACLMSNVIGAAIIISSAIWWLSTRI